MADLSKLSPAARSAYERLSARRSGNMPGINSGHRDADHNAKVGGAKKSQHIHGNALDFNTSGMSPEDRAQFVRDGRLEGFQGFGGYDNAVHMDTASARTWGADFKGTSTPDWLAAVVGEDLSDEDKRRLAGIIDGSSDSPNSTGGGPIMAGVGHKDHDEEEEEADYGSQVSSGLKAMQSGDLSDIQWANSGAGIMEDAKANWGSNKETMAGIGSGISGLFGAA